MRRILWYNHHVESGKGNNTTNIQVQQDIRGTKDTTWLNVKQIVQHAGEVPKREERW